MLNKQGINLQIRKAGSLTEVAPGRPIVAAVSNAKKGEFLYFASKAIQADEPNGNGDYFPWDHLLKSYTSFVGRNLFLNHNSSDPRNAIGKVLDAYPVVDDQSGEKYIECLAKIDAVAHPELARQIESGILDSCSMGCSVESSQCSICAHTIYSDQDPKCRHMSSGLGKEFVVEADLPECNIKKGQRLKAFAVNRGLNFTELSVVNVPAWNNAKIVQIIAQLKDRVAKEPSADVIKDLEDILTMASQNDLEAASTTDAPKLDVETKKECGCTSSKECAKCKKEEKAEAKKEDKKASADESTVESRLTKIFKEKLSALDFLDLQAYMKKANGLPQPTSPVDAPVTPAVAPMVQAKKECGCAEDKSCMKCEKAGEKKDVADMKKVDELLKDALPPAEEALAHEKAELASMPKTAESKAEEKAEAKKEEAKEEKKEEKAEAKKEEAKEEKKAELEARKLKAIFVSKPEIKNSYWVVTADGKPVLKASLNDIWGDKVNEMSAYASSTVYGEALLQRVKTDGLKKVALATNATIYTEAADARGQVGKGDEWPSQKSVGKDEYTPAAPTASAKMKTSPEGTDMSGGAFPGSAGPTGGKGDAYPTSKSMGKSEYKHVGGGGPKVKSEFATYAAEDAAGKIEVKAEAADAPAADMPPMDMPADAPKEDNKEKKDKKEEKAAPAEKMEAPKGDKPLAEMSDEEKLAWMNEAIESMEPGDKLKKPLESLQKAVEKATLALEKDREAAAKEAEKAAAAEAKEAEKAAKEKAKEDEKAAKEAEKAEAAAAKEAEKAAKKEKKDDKGEPEAPAAEAKAEEPKKEEPAMEKTATVEVDLPSVSSREQELEAELAQLKLEASLRAKAQRCQTIVSEMVEKDLIAADEADIQEEIANGKPLFDARAAAFKKAIDKQCRDLLAMEDATLKAFAMTVSRVKGRTPAAPPSGGVLKKAFRLQFDEHSQDDKWLNDVFGNMGSQKGRNL